MQQLTEKEAEDFLEKNEFPVVERMFANKKENLKKINISFPWVMKVSSKKIMHKAIVGGVKTGIDSIKMAEKYFDQLSKIKDFEEAIIQKQIIGEEAILGIKKTPEFGHIIMFGKGGTNIEKERDISFRALPISESEIISMINDTLFSKALEKQEVKNLVKAIKKLQEIVKKNTHILELDINPLMITYKECIIADARIVTK